MFCILCFDGIRLIIGDLGIFIELIVRLLIKRMVHLFANVVVADILYLHLLLDLHLFLNLWSVAMRFIGFDRVTHIEQAFTSVISA